nr:multifunctional oxoglutarate decarboxylase/oxoglutarate dehydrogenase thiamine pyrophosphate-binding subunit/dihydrolipoyllysine-residue succinyltransferase subunit [Actinomycetales bacterium]
MKHVSDDAHRDEIDFGANEWLIEEMYEKYLADPASVEPGWRDFFANYDVDEQSAAEAASAPTTQAEPAPPAAPTTQAEPATRAAPAAPPQPPSAPRSGPAAPPQPTRPSGGEVPVAPSSDMAPTPRAERRGTAVPATREPSRVDPRRSAPELASFSGGALPEPVAQPATTPYAAALAAKRGEVPTGEDEVERLRGVAQRTAKNMDDSLTIPVATSVRSVPAKVLIENRILINDHLSRTRGGKISFTHLIGYAIVEALGQVPDMNLAYGETEDGKPALVRPAHVNLGIAIDLPRPDGTRSLVVPSIKKSDTMDFGQYWAAYEDLVKRARVGKLGVDDYVGTTITLTNPGGIGTVHSIPRVMRGQGTIIGVGALDYPAEYQGASDDTMARAAVSKVLTLTSTYDHRIIQGAASGEFLRAMHQKLIGEDGFYERIFASLRVPVAPARWQRDVEFDPDRALSKSARIAEMIHAFRSRGHLQADVDPLAYRQHRYADLDFTNHGLTIWDLDRQFPTGGFAGTETLALREILTQLRDAYCRTTGIEYMHLQDPAQRRWMQERLERPFVKMGGEEQLQVLHKLGAAEAFETFLQTKFVGQKRFSLEGGESLIPLLDVILQGASSDGMDGVAIGMAHRGRLNVLTNIAGKSYAQVFNEFEGNDPRSTEGSGDVKYHLGTDGRYTSPTGETTEVYLAANPSHLEAVNGVLEGIVRAKQDRIDLREKGYTVLPILIHGDAAFAGQGVVTETLNMSQLRGYRVGGTVHVIVNNQIGFTTGPASSRSSQYATDIVKGLQIPVIHVNGDDPEAVARAAKLAFEYRQEFRKDVVIDMVCYRRRGHNEGDDPSMTQPVMYGLIDAKRTTRQLYTEALVGRGDITKEQAEEALEAFRKQLETAFSDEDRALPQPENAETVAGLEVPASQQEDAGVLLGWQSAVDAGAIARVGEAYAHAPEGFNVHPKLDQLCERRSKMSREGGIDWGFGEILAFGTLLMDGVPVRVAGQDTRRGTFVQRHATFHDVTNGAEWTPLRYLTEDQAKFHIYDSPLSEYAALAFEYGYSVERPDSLVVWEAQFGDFVNGAQTVIDEFISSAEQKWGQRSSLVMLLPHGYEGQGPDHSSGRI